MLLIQLILFTQNIWANPTCTWDVKVNYPDKEVKSYRLEIGDNDLPIQRSKWKCKVTYGSDSGTGPQGHFAIVETMELTCQRGEAKFFNRTACAKTEVVSETLNHFGGTFLELHDGNKKTGVSINFR